MSFTDEEVGTFKSEALELLENAEKGLLLLEKGEDLSLHYDAIFRALHSIKGAAGMMNMTTLQSHMHQLETVFTEQKLKKSLEKILVDFFLKGMDCTHTLLDGGTINFDYTSYLTASNTEPQTAVPTPQKKAEPNLGNVLVVDDEPEIVELVTKILTSQNICVHGLTSAINILSEIEKFKPDAIISDISMPDVSGMDLLELVRKHHVEIPVIFISGNVNKEILMNAIQLGVFSVIEKPFHMIRVTESAVNAIEKSKLTKMFASSINLLMYQFSDLSDYLKAQGKHDIHKVISDEISSLLKQRRSLRRRSSLKAS